MGVINQRKQFLKLINKYLTGKATDDELDFISKYYETFEGEEDVFNSLSEREREDIADRLEHSIMGEINVTTQKPDRRLWKPLSMVAAAIVFITLSIGIYFNYTATKEHHIVINDSLANDIAPGGNKALLTLADGSTISLDDTKNGELVEQEGMKITKTADGLVTYSVASGNKGRSDIPQFNTISTPKGGQYQVILPDGTNVWLNAASSLKYPTAFTSKERRVELNGEAYFEVNSQRSSIGNKIPFYVETSTQTVEVLGTHFNINAYADESSTKTTLVEGAVRVSAEVKGKVASILLKSGEQASINKSHASVSVVDINNFIAWKNGLFQFQDSDIEAVMRELSRWYNVDVEFEGEVPNIKLWGKVYRNVNASEALEILSYFGLKYKITQDGSDKKIIIS